MSAKLRTAALAAATIGAGVNAIAMVSGLLYEQAQSARDREHFPQIGRSVDIGGRMLNIYCSGAGQPAVILESGANWAVNSAVHDPKTIFSNGGPRPGYSWVSIQRALATVTTVCWYDRAAPAGATLVLIRATLRRRLVICMLFSAPRESRRHMCWWANHRPPWMLAFTRASIPPRWPAWCWSTGLIQRSSLTCDLATGNGRRGFLS
jgi:hypothetical protein